MAVERRLAAVPGGAGDDEGEDSVAALLGKNSIAAERALRRTMAMGSVYYGGCGVVVVFFVGWRREPECGELRKGRFFQKLRFSSYVNRSIILCMYVEITKCL